MFKIETIRARRGAAAAAGLLLVLLPLAAATIGGAQEVPASQMPAAGSAPGPLQDPSSNTTPSNSTPANPTAEAIAAPAPKTYTVPAGTKVLLTLQSSVNTKSAKPGDGVYLMSAFPVIVGSRVLIPAGMYVQGTVDSVERHIRIKGHAKLNMHFTSMIFPNGSVIEIPGVVNSIPGSKGPKVKDGEGTVEQTGGAGEVASAAAKGAGLGAGGGVLVGAAENHPFEGAGIGGAGGALVGAAVSLFTHGNDIDIVAGSQVEMVLQRPLVLQDSNLSDANSSQALVPAAQRQPMPKPNPRRVLCPVGQPCQN